MEIKNHITYYRDKLDFHKYESQINIYINQIVHEFTIAYKGIVNFKIRDVFWDFVDDKIEFDRNNWYHVFASMMGKIVMYEMLFEENLKQIFFNPQIKLPAKILKFKTHFSNLFEVLLAKCRFLDQSY